MCPLFPLKLIIQVGWGPLILIKFTFRGGWPHSFCVDCTVRVGLTPLVLCNYTVRGGLRPTRSNLNLLFEEDQASRPPVPTSRRTAVSPALPALPFERGCCSLHFLLLSTNLFIFLLVFFFKFFMAYRDPPYFF